MLFSAVLQVEDALSAMTVSRSIQMIVQGRLPRAFVLGFYFPSAAQLTLLLEGRRGTWSELKRWYDRVGVALLSYATALVVMQGYYLNALEAITLYHYMEDRLACANVCARFAPV